MEKGLSGGAYAARFCFTAARTGAMYYACSAISPRETHWAHKPSYGLSSRRKTCGGPVRWTSGDMAIVGLLSRAFYLRLQQFYRRD